MNPRMLTTCTSPGCNTLTFGPLCLVHEPSVEPRLFPRGRPYRLKEREVLTVPVLTHAAGKDQTPRVVFMEGAL